MEKTFRPLTSSTLSESTVTTEPTCARASEAAPINSIAARTHAALAGHRSGFTRAGLTIRRAARELLGAEHYFETAVSSSHRA
jgi:hypothetical protein